MKHTLFAKWIGVAVTASNLLAISIAAESTNWLRISSTEPLFVGTSEWRAAMFSNSAGPAVIETARVFAPDDRNAICLITVLGKNKAEFADDLFLKKLLRAESASYEPSPEVLIKTPIQAMAVKNGKGVYSSFADPKLKGKPARKGIYKTATPIMVTLGTNYLIKATILCDDLQGADYGALLKIVQSIKVSKAGAPDRVAMVEQ